MKKNEKFNQIDTRLHNQSEWLEFLRKEEQSHHIELKDRVRSLESQNCLMWIILIAIAIFIIISYIYDFFFKGAN